MIRIPTRLALRIYLVTVVAVLGSALAVFLLLELFWGPPRHERFPGTARYAAGHFALLWPDADAIRREVAALRDQAGLAASVYRSGGELVATGAATAPPPLSPGDRGRLAQGEVLKLGRGGAPAHALPIVRSGERVGYATFEPVGPSPPGHPPPPGAVPLVVILLALGVAAALIGSTIARPLDRLTVAARALGAGDLSARTGVRRRDELGAVARAFDDMVERVVALLRGQTELLANVAHELRTPLARIRVALDLAEDADPAATRESLAEIARDLSELERLVGDILASARMDLAQNTTGDGAPPLRRARVALADVIGGAVQRLAQAYPGRAIDALVEAGVPAVQGDAVLLRRALDNLLENARKYSGPETTIALRARRRGDDVVVEVTDRGEGMSPADVASLFTPFFRADRSRARGTGGVGLGLTLTRRIVEAHGGAVRAASALGVGTTMTIVLPAAPEEVETALPPDRTSTRPAAR